MNYIQNQIESAKLKASVQEDVNAFGGPVAKAETKGLVWVFTSLANLLRDHVHIEIPEDHEKPSRSEPFTE